MLKNDKPIVNILFNERERKVIGEFAQAADEITSIKVGGANFSNTAAGLGNALNRLFFVIRPTERMRAYLSPFMIIGDVVQSMSGRAASRAQYRGMPRRPFPPGVGATAGSLYGIQEQDISP